MHRRTARGNRLGLALTGLILALAGTALLLAHRGTFGRTSTRRSIYPQQARSFVHDNTSWLWPVAAAAAILIGLVFLRWLLIQPRTDRLRRLVIDTDQHAGDDPTAGRTRMPAHAITDIVEDDLTALRGVRRATATLSGHTDAPQLWLTVTTTSDADLAVIRSTITSRIVEDARACLELPNLTTYLRLTVTARADGRVVH